jgi:general secretion pathway protein I
MRARTTDGKGDAGFTLLEVLVALALVALAVTSAGLLMRTNSRAVQSVERHTDLLAAARRVAATIDMAVARKELPSGGQMDGYQWRAESVPLVGDDAKAVPYQIHVEVRSPAGALFAFDTVRLLGFSDGHVK